MVLAWTSRDLQRGPKHILRYRDYSKMPSAINIKFHGPGFPQTGKIRAKFNSRSGKIREFEKSWKILRKIREFNKR